MALPMMPKATAVWLVENTTLTFKQIAAFCGLHELEVQAIADDEVAVGMTGLDPLAQNQLTQDELDRCQADPAARLVLATSDIPLPVARTKGARYTPVSKRQDKPDAIAWLLRFFPELTDAQIGKLLGTTKPTINAVRERSHWNSPNIRPRNPVELGMCVQGELDLAVDKAKKRVARADARSGKESGKLAGVGVPVPSAMPATAVPLGAGAAQPDIAGTPASAYDPPPDAPPKKKESVASVFGEQAPEPEQTEIVPTAQEVFGAPQSAPETPAPKTPAAEKPADPAPVDPAEEGTLASLMPKALKSDTPETGEEKDEAEETTDEGDGNSPTGEGKPSEGA